ncbi:hypothetical protein MTO96_011876 [Rhipicephalus appendiculatus]
MSWRNVNATCPKLERCECSVVNQGALTRCWNISQPQELDADMARIEGVVHRKLTFDHVQMTELPATWFTNHTIIMLIIVNSPLRDIGEEAIGALSRMSRMLLENDQLEALPRGLTAAKHLRWLEARKNRIRFLQGTLRLPELFELDLRFNAIERIDGTYLSALPNLKHLRLSGNRIRQLPTALLKNTRKLKKAEFRNNYIAEVGEVFNDMPYIEVLDLSYNMIRDVDRLLKARMPYLSTLNLEHNRISLISEVASSNTMIEELLLNDNEITQVEVGAFAALEGMTSLDLSRNGITYLNGSVFNTGSRLEYLGLSENKLASVTGVFDRTRRLKDLKLSSNRIKDITDAFKGLTLLRKLSLRSNLVTHIPDGAFRDSSGLYELNLSDNKIQWVGRNAFRGLVTLDKLLLQDNLLLALNGSARNLPKLRYVDASNNAIQSLKNGEFANDDRLATIQLTANNISEVRGAFTGVQNLVGLYLRRNQVELLRRSDFDKVLKKKLTIILDENPLLCDCRMSWLVRRDGAVRAGNYPTCLGPQWLQGKLLNMLTRDDLIRWEQDCELGCRCDCREDSLEGTAELELGENRIEELGDALVNGAPRLKVLSLRKNLLTSLNVTNLPENVRSLDLSSNRMKRFPYDLVTKHNLTSLRLSANPFSCECADYPFRQWIESHSNVITDVADVICAESSNSLISLKPFLTLGQKQLCPGDVPRAIMYLLPILVSLVVVLSLSAAYLRYKRELKVWLYARGVCRSLQCIKEDELDEEKLFDVFLSFSSRDSDWVHEQLLPGVEALGFSVCTYERNFKGGFLLQDIIRDAVACSRRTLLLLTGNFMESEWCRWEFRLAYQRALGDHINRLVIVLVDEVPADSLDEDLQTYLRASNYVRWGEPNFWDKLLYSLPKKDSKRKLITNRGSCQLRGSRIHSAHMLVVKNSPLREIERAAVSGIDKLRRVLLENDLLDVVPPDLSAAKRLRWLCIRRNHVKFLKGMLSLPGLLELDLRFNAIEMIDENYLSGMANLQTLRLSVNKIQHLPSALFKDTRKLKHVEIRSNRIRMINALFNDLRYLEMLDLSRNVITDIEDLMESKMPLLKSVNLQDNLISVIPEISASNAMLEKVLLNRNQITQVKPKAFAALEAMSRVEISNNGISRLHQSVFHPYSRLEHLALSGNEMTSVRGTFKNINFVKALALSLNKIEDIKDVFEGLTLLRVLSLRKNLVSCIQDGTFRDNRGLVDINMSDNKIKWVGRNAFMGLVTLNRLILRGNQLLSLNGSVSYLPLAQYLDASFNSIQSLEKGEFANNGRMAFIILAANNISDVQGAFTGATSLVALVLSGNQVQLLRRTDFAERLTAKSTLTIDDNPLMCDCRLAWLRGLNGEVQTRGYPKCESPPWLRGKLLHDLPRRQLIRWEEKCESGCECDCHEGSLGERTIAVNCSSAALYRTPRSFPEGTTRLELRDNRIEELDDALINGAPHLEVLSLRNNLLTHLNILDARDIVCAKNSDSRVSLKAFVTLGQKELCPSAVPAVIAYLIPALVSLVVVLSLSAAYLRYKRELKVWLYARGVCRSLQCIKEDELDEEKLFDVFLSFSSRDADWVHEQLLPGVEALGFSVCTYERNFKGGFLLQDIIRDAVACSRRTLLLLTGNFVESEWCRWEFRLAYQRAMDDHINRLVIVLVDGVVPESLDEDLRACIVVPPFEDSRARAGWPVPLVFPEADVLREFLFCCVPGGSRARIAEHRGRWLSRAAAQIAERRTSAAAPSECGDHASGPGLPRSGCSQSTSSAGGLRPRRRRLTHAGLPLH